MCEKQQKSIFEYQLRTAAGKFWLIHMEQRGIPYERPLQLNSIGAEMWKLFCKEMNSEQVATILAREYQMEINEVREDVRRFCQQLRGYGISIGE